MLAVSETSSLPPRPQPTKLDPYTRLIESVEIAATRTAATLPLAAAASGHPPRINSPDAALDLANQGIEVYLVENQPTIGGKMAQLDRIFPTDDCGI